MKIDMIQTYLNRYSTSQRESMIRFRQYWIDSIVIRFKNLCIDALEVRDLWWYDSNTSESI